MTPTSPRARTRNLAAALLMAAAWAVVPAGCAAPGGADIAEDIDVPSWLLEGPADDVVVAPAERERKRRTRSQEWFFGGEEEKEVRESTPPARTIRLGDIRKEIVRETQRHGAVERGRKLYRMACATCHGKRGDGWGPSAEGLETWPADLTGGLYMYASGEGVQLDRDLFQVLSEGVVDTEMPGWKKLLSERDRWSVVAYIKTL